jgi:TPR repeat protein
LQRSNNDNIRQLLTAGVPEAIQYYKKAAENRDADAVNALIKYYDSVNDMKNGVRYYELTADMNEGDVLNMCNC